MIKASQRDLDELLALPGNPKGHDQAGIGASVGRFGFLERIVINQTTGHIISGHGRAESLRASRDAGEQPPKNVVVKDGRWVVPIDLVDLDEKEEMAAAIALNRWTERGGWDDVTLLTALQGLGTDEESLKGVGFDLSDVDAMLAFAVNEDEKMKDNSGTSASNAQLDDRGFIYSVIVDFDNENAQASLLAELETRGLKCRLLIS